MNANITSNENAKPNSGKVRISLDLSPALNETLEEIMAEEHITKSELLRRAIGLLKVANDAKKRGQSLGLLDEQGKPLTLIIGV
ncbi:ribbon-helix-helix protein, CopG family [Hyalangium minutum]|uniref:ribbon-helix-helix protein, CopG family n=1 Tax=Hyalangium minutum TaxID=394096 RepID=UPI0005C52B69|nr:ribbon-helix-helix protein, CopG family [Hyalangium minutum]